MFMGVVTPINIEFFDQGTIDCNYHRIRNGNGN